MLTHVVLFKLKDPTPSTVEEVKHKILSMQGKIPFLRHLEVGVDILHSERSFDIALVAKFDSIEHMQAYQIHPVHVDIADYMVSIREKSVTVDYEIP